MIGFLKSQKGLISVTIGNLGSALIIGLFWLLLASLQTVEEYGETTYFYSFASLLASASLLGFNTTVLKFGINESNRISIQANQIILVSSGIFAIASAFINLLLVPFVMGMAFWMMTTYDLLGKKNYKNYALIMIATRTATFGAAIGLYFVIGVLGVILGFTISFLIFSYKYFFSLKNFRWDFSEIKKKMKFSSHAYSSNMSNATFMFLDKLVIVSLFGFTTLGFYQFGFQFLLFIGMIPISFYQYLVPEESTGESKGKLRMFGFLVSVLLSGIILAASPWFLNTFFPSFASEVDGFRIMSLGIIPMMVVWILNSKFLTLEKTKYVVFGSMFFIISQISLFFVLGNIWGVFGLGTAVVTSLSLQASFLFGCSRYLKIDF